MSRKNQHLGPSKVVRLALPTVEAAHRFAGDGLTDTLAVTSTILANEGGNLERLRDAVNARQTGHAVRVALATAEAAGVSAEPLFLVREELFAVRVGEAYVRCGAGIPRLVTAELRRWGIHFEPLTEEPTPEPLPQLEDALTD